MEEAEFFSFKLIIHEVRLNASSVFVEQKEKTIKNPIFFVKFLKFPMLVVKAKDSISRENIASPSFMKSVFSTGISTVFKSDSQNLKDNLAEIPLKMIFVDYDFHKNQITKSIAKCSISLDTFLEDLGKNLEDTEENFRRHCFYLYNNNRQIIGLIDLSISFAKRASSFADRLKSNQSKAIKKPSESKSKEMYATFGTKPNKLFVSSNGRDVKQHIDHEVQTEFYEKTQEIKKTPFHEQKENNFSNANTCTYVNPTLKVMLEGNFCPPPMFLMKKKTDDYIPPVSNYNTQNFISTKPIIFPTNKNPPNDKEITPQNHTEESPRILKNIQKINENPEKFPTDRSNNRPFSIIDQLIEELIALKAGKSPIRSSNTHPLRVSSSFNKKMHGGASLYDRRSQKISIKDLEKTPKKEISEEYPEDFESISMSPSQKKSRIATSKSALVPEQNSVNPKKTHEYSEDFESYTISDTLNKVKLDSKSLSESNSQSNSQQKMVTCFVCGSKIEAYKASEHAKSCKASNLRYSMKKTEKLVSNSINSIQEEEEKDMKENYASNKQSLIKESIRSEEYIDDFHSIEEESNGNRENF